MVIFSHLGPLEPSGGLCGPLLCPTSPHMELGTPVCHFRCSVGKKNPHLKKLIHFWPFVPWEAVFWGCYGVLTPSWGQKYPTVTHMDLYPSVCVLPWPITKTQILMWIWFIFFLFFYFFIFFFIFLGLFLASFDPYSGSHWAQGPHMDHNPEVYYMSIESAKKWTLIIDSVHFFFVSHYGHF